MRITTLFILLILLGLTFGSASVRADCANPAGVAGNQVYNTTYQVMQFCDGTNWISMKGGTANTLDALACNDGEIAKWNNGASAWQCAADDAGVGSETDPQVGTLTSGKWCTTDGTDIDCTSDAPSGGGLASCRICCTRNAGFSTVETCSSYSSGNTKRVANCGGTVVSVAIQCQ